MTLDFNQGVPDFMKEAKEIGEEFQVNELHFTKDELFFIEERCDIETSLCLRELVNALKIDTGKCFGIKIRDIYIEELIDTYEMLKQLRIKLENYRKNERI